MTTKTAADRRVEELIRRACPLAQPALGAELELHRHLGFSSDDLRRLLRSLHQAFGTDFSALEAGDYAPPPASGALTCEVVPLRSYRGLTVGDIERAVAEGRWREAG